MSNEVKTYLVNDERLNVESQVEMAVKNGPQSSITQKYKQSSNSSSSIMFNINVPSENTLVSRKLEIESTMCFYTTATAAIPLVNAPLMAVPSAFPMNTAISSASMTVNNCSVSVASQDVLERVLKQYSPEFLAKNCSTTAYLPDKYYGTTHDSFAEQDKSSSSVSGVVSAEKDGLEGRSSSRFEFFRATSAAPTVLIPYTINNTGPDMAVGDHLIMKIYTREPIIGMPGLEMTESGSFVGVNNIELNLQLNDGSRCTCSKVVGTANFTFQAGLPSATGKIFEDDASVVMKYFSLPPSEYSKMNTKNVVSYNEFVSYKTVSSSTVGSIATFPSQLTSNNTQLRQIPDKILVVVEPSYSSRTKQFSNNFAFPISSINVTLNNRANLLSELNIVDLFEMSKRNGSKQPFSEFIGQLTKYEGIKLNGSGPVIIIDPVRDLQLDSYLSSGSVGAFNLQITVNYGEPLSLRFVAGGTLDNTDIITAFVPQLNIICSYGGVLITQQGTSAAMSGLLSKVLVLETKDAGSSAGDYDEVEEMSGGNVSRGLTSIGETLRKKGKDKLKSVASKAVSKGADMLQSKISGAGNPSSYNYSGGSYYS